MEEELKQAKEKITELEGKVTTLTKENTDYKAGADEFTKQMKEKDTLIEDMQVKARERGEQFKKLRDYSKEEQELLTEKEKELLLRQEALEENNKKFQEDQNNFQKTQRDALVDSLAMKKAGGNRDLADKLKITLGKIKDIETKITEADLTPEIDFAFNGLNIQTTPDPLLDANNQGGAGANFTTDTGYADTADGKSVASALGLSQAQPEVTNNK
jgi:hypothetical protein